MVVEHRQPLGHERRHADSIPRLAHWGTIYEEGNGLLGGSDADGMGAKISTIIGLAPLCCEIRSSLLRDQVAGLVAISRLP